MCIENWSENVILVSLPGEPGTADLLEDIAVLVDGRDDCDVVLDCSTVKRLGHSSSRQLLELNSVLNSCGHQLVLCGPQRRVKQAFAWPVVTTMLQFADDRFSALARLGLSHP
jgi:anti-anti-sigma regulatory factor